VRRVKNLRKLFLEFGFIWCFGLDFDLVLSGAFLQLYFLLRCNPMLVRHTASHTLKALCRAPRGQLKMTIKMDCFKKAGG